MVKTDTHWVEFCARRHRSLVIQTFIAHSPRIANFRLPFPQLVNCLVSSHNEHTHLHKPTSFDASERVAPTLRCGFRTDMHRRTPFARMDARTRRLQNCELRPLEYPGSQLNRILLHDHVRIFPTRLLHFFCPMHEFLVALQRRWLRMSVFLKQTRVPQHRSGSTTV